MNGVCYKTNDEVQVYPQEFKTKNVGRISFDPVDGMVT